MNHHPHQARLEGWADYIDRSIRENTARHGLDSAIVALIQEAYGDGTLVFVATLEADFEEVADSDDVCAALGRLSASGRLVTGREQLVDEHGHGRGLFHEGVMIPQAN
jgi:hypothetical protein